MPDQPVDEMQELIRDFIVETEEILESLDQCFVKLEESPGNLELINEIFRAAHSIKGSAGFLGFTRLVEVAHQSENVLNKLRQKEMHADQETIDIILESVDVLKNLLKEVKEGSGECIDIGPIKRKLALLLEYAGECTGDNTKEEGNPSPPDKYFGGKLLPSPLRGEGWVREGFSDERGDRPSGLSSKAVGQGFSLASGNPEGLPYSLAANVAAEVTGSNEQEKDQTLRIETKRLDQVMDLVGELVLSRNRLSKILSDIEELYNGDEKIKTLLDTASNLNLITTDLQLAVMKMRMVPVRKVFNKFPRMVRDMARKADKKINLEMYGEATEIDKSVIEELSDPLVHIIRNSIDHGIEPPAERVKKGKPEYGTIRLGAFHEGNAIAIQIEDDGKGIDPVVVERKAREKGLIKPQDIKLAPKEVIKFIFEPGFSTAEKLTDISGRGVGMDVVKTNISRINGIIDVNSEVGKGTQVILKIPLTLAIIQVLMVKIDHEIYALPLSSVLETFRVSRDSIKSVDGQDILNVRDRLIPLVRLSNVLDIHTEDTTKEWVYVVLMAIAGKKVGIVVDELCHQEEVVIKSVGTYFTDIKEVSGATITGDGKVGLILDPGALISRHKDLAT